MTIKGFRILVSAIAVFLFASASAVAQPMPVDSLIIKGTLDNGMTYYIRHNANPKGYADFYIVHNVGVSATISTHIPARRKRSITWIMFRLSGRASWILS